MMRQRARQNNEEVLLRYNPALDMTCITEADDQEAEEVIELHAAEERNVAVRGLVASGKLVATGGKTVGLVLVVPTMVYTLLINCLQVANSIWGKWPNQNPPQVTYVSGLDGLLVPTIAYPQYVSPFSQFCPLQKMDDWAEACAETTTDGSPLDDMRNMLKCMHDRGDFLGCDANAGAWLRASIDGGVG